MRAKYSVSSLVTRWLLNIISHQSHSSSAMHNNNPSPSYRQCYTLYHTFRLLTLTLQDSLRSTYGGIASGGALGQWRTESAELYQYLFMPGNFCKFYENTKKFPVIKLSISLYIRTDCSNVHRKLHVDRKLTKNKLTQMS